MHRYMDFRAAFAVAQPEREETLLHFDVAGQRECQLVAALHAGELPEGVVEVVFAFGRREDDGHLLALVVVLEFQFAVVDVEDRAAERRQVVLLGLHGDVPDDGADRFPLLVQRRGDMDPHVIDIRLADRHRQLARRERHQCPGADGHVGATGLYGGRGCPGLQCADREPAQSVRPAHDEEFAVVAGDEVLSPVDVDVRVAEQRLAVLLVVHVDRHGSLGVAGRVVVRAGGARDRHRCGEQRQRVSEILHRSVVFIVSRDKIRKIEIRKGPHDRPISFPGWRLACAEHGTRLRINK